MRCSGVLVLAAMLATTGGCTSREQAIVATVCAPVEGGYDESIRIDVGLLTLAPPPGYRFAGAQHEVHGGIGFVDASGKAFGLGNGYWSAESFRDGPGDPPKPDCEFRVDDIPVQLFHFRGDADDAESDKVMIHAIIGYPDRPSGEKVMQSMAGAAIPDGDLEHAAAFRAFIHSIRRGDARQFVRGPDEKPKLRQAL